MHFNVGKVLENVGDVLKLRPVELDVLARCEVPVIAIVGARDMPEGTHLLGVEQPVGNRDAQHVRVLLVVQAVHQPQRAKLIFGQLARQAAPHLIAELVDSLLHDLRVARVILVHSGSSSTSDRGIVRR